MDNVENGEKSADESSPLRIDPKCFKEALRAFFQPIKNGDPRLDFYTVYKKEAAEYDMDYVKKYDEDLNTTLIFAGLFSAVSSAFAIDIYPKLQPDPNDQSAALLRAILLTLNRSAIPDESSVVPPVRGHTPGGIVTATALLYASLMISLLAAFTAMLGKQWLNRYLRHTGGSMVERCGDRQRKCDGLEKWPFHLFVESLPVMLQVALLLLASGLCQYMVSINTAVAYTLISLTGLGLLFYAGIVIAGASSYECPFQTPGSAPLRSLWKKVWPRLIATALTLRALGAVVQRQITRVMVHSPFPHFDILPRLRHFSERVQLGILHVVFCLPPMGLNICPFFRRPPPPIIQEGSPSPTPQEIVPWFAPDELAKIQMKNTNDVRCVSWVIRNITDPEALDTAIQRAGTIRWFDNGIDVKPIYDLIISNFHPCFGSDGKVYPGSTERAYYSGRAILWIHTLAMCRSYEFPLPTARYRATGSDDLRQLLEVMLMPADNRFGQLLLPRPGSTPSHSQWVSNVLLHQSWAGIKPGGPWVHYHFQSIRKISMPLDVLLNRLLMYCSLLGLPVEEEVLKIQDKFDRLGRVLNQVTRAICSALHAPHPQGKYIEGALLYLAKLENRPRWLIEAAYGWCAVIWKNRHSCGEWKTLLFLSLEVGFRCFDVHKFWHPIDLNHTEHHQELAKTVFESGRSEAIEDLLCALTVFNEEKPGIKSFYACKQYIINIQNNIMGNLSPRQRRLVMYSIRFIGYGGFEEAESERFVALLNHLSIIVEEADSLAGWCSTLMEAAQSPQGHKHLAVQSWELLVKLTIQYSRRLRSATYTPYITSSLLEAQEWEKLKCWIGVVWMVWPPETDSIPEEVKHAMQSLFHHLPGAVQQLTEWMEQWSKKYRADVPVSFQKICQQVCGAALPSLPPNQTSEESLHPSPSGSDKFWELLPLI